MLFMNSFGGRAGAAAAVPGAGFGLSAARPATATLGTTTAARRRLTAATEGQMGRKS
jgi:hypothetical protein